MYYTKDVRPERKPEKLGGKSMVETAGYIPARQQVENLLQAGVNLKNYRMETYDFKPGEKDNGFTDPTRKPGYDLADAVADSKSVKSRLETQQKEAAEAAKKKKEMEIVIEEHEEEKKKGE